MSIRFALPLAFLFATPALAQEAALPVTPSPAPTATLAPPPSAGIVKVALQTSEGVIVLALEKDKAPITTANFLKYLDTKKLDGITIYRAVKVQDGFGLIQGGLRNDPKKILKPITLEPTSKTGLTHKDGTISMARAAPNSATMDFFICVGDQPAMDADPAKPGDNQGFAAFGQVVEGMDVVRHILTEPTTEAGPVEMKGQMLAQPVKIVSARRLG